MKKIIIILLLLVPLFSAANNNIRITNIEGINNKRPGVYLIHCNQALTYTRSGLGAMLYIPKTIVRSLTHQTPLIVFYHGVVGNRDYYKNNVGFIINWAEKYKFVLLSIPNIWGLDSLTSDTSTAISETLIYTKQIIEKINSYNIYNINAIYTTGFSAGGLVALCSVLLYPEIVNGFGNFKGNFYPDVVNAFINPGLDSNYYLNKKNFVAFFAVGGVHETQRVKEQFPQAIHFVSNIVKMPYITKKYPQEGHIFSENNFSDFYLLVKKSLKTINEN